MDDVGYGGMNQITGEVENSIPKYYTVDFTRTEDGSYDNSDLSLDFFKKPKDICRAPAGALQISL